MYERGLDAPLSRRFISFGSFTLKSGLWSPYFVNIRPILSFDPESRQPIDKQRRITGLFLDQCCEKLDDIETKVSFDHIYGPPEAGTPLAAAIAAKSGRSLLWRRVVDKSNRGVHAALEGVYYPGQKVAGIDDVISLATAKQEENEFLDDCGLEMIGTVVGVDREMGGRQTMEDLGWEVRDVLSATAIFNGLQQANILTEAQRDFLLEYSANPGQYAMEPSDNPLSALG